MSKRCPKKVTCKAKKGKKAKAKCYAKRARCKGK